MWVKTTVILLLWSKTFYILIYELTCYIYFLFNSAVLLQWKCNSVLETILLLLLLYNRIQLIPFSYKISSAVKRLIAINRIQNIFYVYIIYVCAVYIY